MKISKGKISKWLLILGGIVVLIVITSAVGGGKKEKIVPGLKEKQIYQIGEEIPCKDWVWKVVSAKEDKGFQVKEGKVIKVIIEGKNIGKKKSSRKLILSIIDDKGRKYRNDIGYREEKEEELKGYQILYDCGGWLQPGFSPGRCVEGFTVPQDSEGLRLHIDDPGHCEANVNLSSGKEVEGKLEKAQISEAMIEIIKEKLKEKQTIELPEFEVPKEEVSTSIISGQITKISDRRITLKTGKGSLSIQIQEDAKIYFLNLHTNEKAEIIFEEIKVGDNADVLIKREEGVLIGIEITILSR